MSSGRDRRPAGSRLVLFAGRLEGQKLRPLVIPEVAARLAAEGGEQSTS